MDDSEREFRKDVLRQLFEQTLDERVDRYLSINHQRIVALHHFSHPSSECLDLYRDGYFTSCVVMTQAVAEGIVKFVGERNGLKQQEKESRQEFIKRMHGDGILTSDFVDAFDRLMRSFRNDYHHMNPAVAQHDFVTLAERNIQDLAVIEREIFGCTFHNGHLVPNTPLYWDIGPDGTVPVYVRG